MNANNPLSFRIEPGLHKRLEECARRTRIKKYTLALMAIEAAVEAIEKNGYRLVVPIQFKVESAPTPATDTKSAPYPPAATQQYSRTEDKPVANYRTRKHEKPT